MEMRIGAHHRYAFYLEDLQFPALDFEVDKQTISASGSPNEAGARTWQLRVKIVL
jgi:hypothetical protein